MTSQDPKKLYLKSGDMEIGHPAMDSYDVRDPIIAVHENSDGETIEMRIGAVRRKFTQQWPERIEQAIITLDDIPLPSGCKGTYDYVPDAWTAVKNNEQEILDSCISKA